MEDKYRGFFFSSRRRHTRWTGDWSSDVCSSDLPRWCRTGTFAPASVESDSSIFTGADARLRINVRRFAKINHRRAREIGCALDLRAFCSTLVKDNYGHDDAEHNRKRGQHTLPKVRMGKAFNYAFFQTIELVVQKSNWI